MKLITILKINTKNDIIDTKFTAQFAVKKLKFHESTRIVPSSLALQMLKNPFPLLLPSSHPF